MTWKSWSLGSILRTNLWSDQTGTPTSCGLLKLWRVDQIASKGVLAHLLLIHRRRSFHRVIMGLLQGYLIVMKVGALGVILLQVRGRNLMSVFVCMQKRMQLCLRGLNEPKDAQFMWQLIHVQFALKWLFKQASKELYTMNLMTPNSHFNFYLLSHLKTRLK